MKNILSLIIALATIFVCSISIFAINPSQEGFNFNEQFTEQTLADGKSRIGQHTVAVQAWEKKAGTIRCTILNEGPDMLDNVTVYVRYRDGTGWHDSVTRDYGAVPVLISQWEEIYIGNFYEAKAYWKIKEDGKTYTMQDTVGE